MCRSEEIAIFPNKQANRAVRSLCVFCTNKDKGCEWQGEVNYIISHLEGCQFEMVTCSNDCGKCFQWQYLTSHVENECVRRKVDCQYCHITGEHQFIKGKHNEQCPKYAIACPNSCEVSSVPRDEVAEHLKMCQLELVQCEYHMVGCEERMACKDHNKEKMEEHLSFTIKELMLTKGHLQQQNSVNLSLKLQQTENDLKRELAAAKEILKSTQTEARNVRMQLKETNNALSIATQELAVTKRDLKTTMRLQPQLTKVLQKPTRSTLH
ncbi:TNF receptor-associated factor 2-like [Dysidea avara]|uniref:TNF receptor-associated factor 2-like n=1 Tax=Dysidea avara TaxID=196820 RepID=UPI0033343988